MFWAFGSIKTNVSLVKFFWVLRFGLKTSPNISVALLGHGGGTTGSSWQRAPFYCEACGNISSHKYFLSGHGQHGQGGFQM